MRFIIKSDEKKFSFRSFHVNIDGLIVTCAWNRWCVMSILIYYRQLNVEFYYKYGSTFGSLTITNWEITFSCRSRLSVEGTNERTNIGMIHIPTCCALRTAIGQGPKTCRNFEWAHQPHKRIPIIIIIICYKEIVKTSSRLEVMHESTIDPFGKRLQLATDIQIESIIIIIILNYVMA